MYSTWVKRVVIEIRFLSTVSSKLVEVSDESDELERSLYLGISLRNQFMMV